MLYHTNVIKVFYSPITQLETGPQKEEKEEKEEKEIKKKLP